MKLLYRVYNMAEAICVDSFTVLRETKHGAWIIVEGKEKFVLHTHACGGGPVRKRYAYPTKAEALNSFKIRKQWCIKHAEWSTSVAKKCLAKIAAPDFKVDDVSLYDTGRFRFEP